MDCSSPMSAKTSRKTGRRVPGLGRHVQAGLVHQREQAERPERDGLAARVRARDDERRVALAEADVDGHDAPGEARVAGRQQDDLRAGRRSPDGRRPSPPRAAPWRPRSRTGPAPPASPGAACRWRPTRAESSSRIRPSSSSTAAWASRQALPSSTTTSGSTNSVWPLPGRVVDDALDPGPRVGADRHDVAPVAHRDQRLLERAAQLRADERVQAAAEPVVGDPDGAPAARPGAARRCPAARPWDRSCAASVLRRAGSGCRRRPRSRSSGRRSSRQRRGEAGGGVERLHDLEEMGGIEATAPDRPPDPWVDVVGAADADAGPLLEQGTRLVGLVEAAPRR